MKKLFCIFVFLTLAVTIYCQDKPTKEESEVNQVIDKVFDRTTESIQQLASALKVPADHVYSVLVKQQVVTGVSITIALIVVTIGFIFCLRWAIKENHEDEYSLNIGSMLSTIMTGMGFVICIVLFFTTGIQGILNPEYGAIKEIMNILK